MTFWAGWLWDTMIHWCCVSDGNWFGWRGFVIPG